MAANRSHNFYIHQSRRMPDMLLSRSLYDDQILALCI